MFKSIEINEEFFISFIAFKIKTDEPPSATPSSKQFLGLYFLIIPLIILFQLTLLFFIV